MLRTNLIRSISNTILLKVFAVTFIVVAIFRKSNDASDDEIDSDDDGGPIYVDKSIQNLEEFIKPMDVNKRNLIGTIIQSKLSFLL